MAGNYLETVKSSLIKRLFNAETLSRKDVTANDNDLCLSSTFHLAASSSIQKRFI